MKKILFAAGLLFMGSVSHAAWTDSSLLNKSSFTNTNESLAMISSRTLPGGILRGVVVSSSMANGVLTIYDSLGAASGTIAVLSLYNGNTSGAFYIPFDVRISSGLTYTTAGNTVGVSIIYLITKPQ